MSNAVTPCEGLASWFWVCLCDSIDVYVCNKRLKKKSFPVLDQLISPFTAQKLKHGQCFVHVGCFVYCLKCGVSRYSITSHNLGGVISVVCVFRLRVAVSPTKNIFHSRHTITDSRSYYRVRV